MVKANLNKQDKVVDEDPISRGETGEDPANKSTTSYIIDPENENPRKETGKEPENQETQLHGTEQIEVHEGSQAQPPPQPNSLGPLQQEIIENQKQIRVNQTQKGRNVRATSC
jgi:hypothetical protein